MTIMLFAYHQPKRSRKVPTEFEKPHGFRSGNPLNVGRQFFCSVHPRHGDHFEESYVNHQPRGRVIVDNLKKIRAALQISKPRVKLIDD